MGTLVLTNWSVSLSLHRSLLGQQQDKWASSRASYYRQTKVNIKGVVDRKLLPQHLSGVLECKPGKITEAALTIISCRLQKEGGNKNVGNGSFGEAGSGVSAGTWAQRAHVWRFGFEDYLEYWRLGIG